MHSGIERSSHTRREKPGSESSCREIVASSIFPDVNSATLKSNRVDTSHTKAVIDDLDRPSWITYTRDAQSVFFEFSDRATAPRNDRRRRQRRYYYHRRCRRRRRRRRHRFSFFCQIRCGVYESVRNLNCVLCTSYY